VKDRFCRWNIPYLEVLMGNDKRHSWLGHGLNCFLELIYGLIRHIILNNIRIVISMLADNVLVLLMKYLAVLVDFGFLGFFILLIFIFFLLFCYYKQPGDEKRAALLSLLSAGVFSLFSYPFTYPFVWVIVCFDIHILIKRVGHWRFTPVYKSCHVLFFLGFV
jgi:hypothetical protein